MSDAMNGAVRDTTVYTSSTIDTESGVIFVKFVNSEPVNKVFTINIGSDKTFNAVVEYISSYNTDIKNQKDQNYYSSHPDYATNPSVGGPASGERPGTREMAFRFGRRVSYTEAVVPHTLEIGEVKNEFEYSMPENSIGIIKLIPLE